MISSHLLAISMTDIIWFQIKLITIYYPLRYLHFESPSTRNDITNNHPKKPGVIQSQSAVSWSVMNGLRLRWNRDRVWRAKIDASALVTCLRELKMRGQKHRIAAIVCTFIYRYTLLQLSLKSENNYNTISIHEFTYLCWSVICIRMHFCAGENEIVRKIHFCGLFYVDLPISSPMKSISRQAHHCSSQLTYFVCRTLVSVCLLFLYIQKYINVPYICNL